MLAGAEEGNQVRGLISQQEKFLMVKLNPMEDSQNEGSFSYLAPAYECWLS